MVFQLLVPGMEDLDDPGRSAEIFPVRRKLQKGLGTAAVKQAVKKLLVAEDQGVQFMGQGKDHMEIGCVDHFRAAAVHPQFLFHSLTVRAVPVPAGIIVEQGKAAVFADADITAEGSGLAHEYVMGRFALDVRDTAA